MLLFIDDEPDIHEILTEYLSEYDIQSHSAYSVPEAFQFLQKNKYKLVICDLVLEHGKGENILQYMRKNESIHRDTPVILISGKKVPENLGTLTKFLEKPFSKEELLDCYKTIHGDQKNGESTNLHPDLKKLLGKKS